jgi:phosphatidylglycerol lysyltransferase
MWLSLKRLLRHLPAALGVVLLIGAVYVVQREFRHLNVRDVGHALHAIPRSALLASGMLTLLAYALLTFYDKLATIYAGHYVSFARTAFASFCAYSLAHNLGFAAVSGAAVRFRLYAHWGLTPVQIGKVVAFSSLTFGLGGMTLGGAILFFEPGSVPVIGAMLPHWALFLGGLLMWAIVGGYVVTASLFPVLRLRGREIDLPGWRMALAQVALATADVSLTASIFYALLPHVAGLSWLRFLAIYLGSYAAGLISNVPGGLGVFDTAILLGLQATKLPPPVVLGALAVFRLYYYVVPLFLAGAMFAGNEVFMGRKRMAGAAPGQARWSEPDFAVAASTGAVALCGAMLLSIGVLDTHPDYSWIDTDFASFASSAGQYVPSLLGSALMVLAIGLSQRVTLAWGATIIALLIGAALTALQGEPVVVPAVLVVAALSIAPFRDAYYRHARLLSHPLRPGTVVPVLGLLFSVMWLASFEPKVRNLAQTSWWAVVISRNAPAPIRAAVALAVCLAGATLWGVIRPGRVRAMAWDAESRLRYVSLGGLLPDEADGLVMGEAARSAIPFRRVGRVLLGLGDPAGAESDRISAIWRLRDLAQQEGRDAAVWRASTDYLKIYGDLGLTAMPLGQDGLPLPDGEPPAVGQRRYLCCVVERDLMVLLPLLPGLGRRRFQTAT